MAHGPDTKELLETIQKTNKVWLIAGLNVTSLPELPAGLQALHCYNNQITSLPELPAGLQELDCSHTQLTSLPELPAGLQKLYCSHTQLTSLPELPAGLKELYCWHTQLTSLPELPTGLKELYCWNTLLTSLPELPDGLQELNCSYTPLILQWKEGESISDYNLRWREWREEQASKKRIQEKNKLLKEEIAMEVWKPERMERWIEAGYDPDE
jgi:Leucine-rich repeat (LRR) protein